MTEGCVFQVVLTGERLSTCDNAQLVTRLKARFKVSEAQALSMLAGRTVVKRDVDATTAQKMAAVLCELGLQAIAQEVPRPVDARAAERMQRLGETRTASVAAPPTTPALRDAPPKPSAPSPAPLDALLALREQRLPRPRTSFAYLCGLVLVTLLCVMLPAIYVGLTATVAFGWVWYLTHIHAHLPGSIHLKALVYAAPGLAGAVLIVFLLRPFFARTHRSRQTLTLDPDKEPRFVAGVHALCRLIGVSPPVEIRLTWDANASVQFRTPWLSLFTGHKILTIGMSLVAGLSARQFVGVLAHEFGHFSQRLGMICSFTVNSVNAWLEQCAYGDDPWSHKLRAWADAAAEKEQWFSWIIGISVAASSLAIYATRHLMAALFHVSLRLSKYMSRQMEFDADRYEALLAGSQAFRTTARSLRAMNHAFAEVNQANIEAWQEHRLLRDLPEAVARHANEYRAERLTRIEEEMQEETTTRYWDSHPPDTDRIENAERLNAPGVYRNGAPATRLFANAASWSQRATQQFYAEQGVRFTPQQLGSFEDVLGHVRARDDQREQLNRFFNGQFQPWPLLQVEAELAAESAGLTWQGCIDRIRSRSPEIARRWSQAQQLQERRGLLRTAVALGASSRELGMPGPERTHQALAGELQTIVEQRLEIYQPLTEDFALYALRIRHAIESLAESDRVRAAGLMQALAGIGALAREVNELDELAEALRVVSGMQTPEGEAPAPLQQLETAFAELATQVVARADRIAQSVTPDGSVGAYLRSRCPTLQSTSGKAASTERARAYWPTLGAWHRLYMLTLGELVSLCEDAEKSASIRPIRLVA